MACGGRETAVGPSCFQQVDPGNPLATKAVARLEPVVNERREKLKDEMLGGQGGARLQGYLWGMRLAAVGQWVSASRGGQCTRREDWKLAARCALS